MDRERRARAGSRRLVAAALISLVAPGAVDAQLGPLRGYSLSVGTGSESSPFGESGVGLFQRVRLMLTPRAGPVDFDVAYEQALQLRSADLAVTAALGAPVATTWLDLQWTLVDEDHVTWVHRFDRLWVGTRGSWWELTVGRQTVSWATTLFLTPADPFAPFDPSDPFREYRAGIDAARVQVYPGSLSELDLVVRPADTPDGTTLTALLRGRTALGGRIEASAWGGLIHDGPGGAVGLSGSVGGYEVRTEASVREDPDGSGAALRLAAGVDGRFTVASRDLYVVAEYQHDGFGAASPDQLLGVLLSDPYARGELQVLGRDEIAVSGQYQLHPLWSVQLLTLVNLRDPSALLAPAAAWSVAADVSARGGLFLSLGDGRADPDQGLGSEYGAVPVSAYVSLTWFF